MTVVLRRRPVSASCPTVRAGDRRSARTTTDAEHLADSAGSAFQLYVALKETVFQLFRPRVATSNARPCRPCRAASGRLEQARHQGHEDAAHRQRGEPACHAVSGGARILAASSRAWLPAPPSVVGAARRASRR